MKHKFPYTWYLKNGYPAPGIENHGLKVFGTFICGGGSSMGYKLAGFNHLGGVEIDAAVSNIYEINHKPKYLYNIDIREFNKINDLPAELFELDILDGSPPCSSFSMVGQREKHWGKQKLFKEGQTKQILDDLVFVYCDTIIKLKPKTFILENVKGIISGNAKAYAKKIIEKMTAAGYDVQVFCLNAASMGVPQKRERVFFIGSQKSLKFLKLKFSFTEPAIPFRAIAAKTKNETHRKVSAGCLKLWQKTMPGNQLSSAHPKGNYFTHWKISDAMVCPTLTSTAGTCNHYCRADMPVYTNNTEWILCGSFPMDYNFLNMNPKYLIGMSVPPVMTAQISYQLFLQWFKPRLNGKG
jgi:DNA (cytosine-5)-methyltransferase 1